MADTTLAQLEFLNKRANAVITTFDILERELQEWVKLRTISDREFLSIKKKLMDSIDNYFGYLDILNRALAPDSAVAELIKREVNTENLEAERRRWVKVIMTINTLKANDLKAFIAEMKNIIKKVKSGLGFLQSGLVRAILARKAA